MRRSSLVLVVVLFTCGTGLAGQTGVTQVLSHRSAGEFDPAAFAAEQERQLALLVAEQVEEGLAVPLSIELSASEIRDIERGSCDGCQGATEALLAGMVKPVEMTFTLGAFTHGAVKRTVDGGLVWSAAIASNDAAGLRVHFTDFSLPAGYELWLYSMDGRVRGPYTGSGPNGSGEFWSHTVGGPEAVLQLRGSGSPATERGASFTISELGHVGRGATLKNFCTFNAPCIENGECFNTSAVADSKNAIAHMQYVKRPYIYFCSGGLLNDTADSETPYFLTANHCISRNREAGTLEAFFQFTIPCNSSACPDYNQINAPSTIGAAVLATNKASDFTLLELSQAPPSGSVFMGWNATPVVETGASLYRISHPGGAPQAYSQHDEWVPPVVCSGWARGPWIYSKDIVGATEGGSSGSPVVNASGQVVGQLSGGCGYNVNDNCDNIQNSTVDGAFAAYYDQVASWLAPGGGSCTDDDNDGYCAENDDCNDGDFFVNPGVAEICDDLIDNNCDGAIDEGCAGSCLPNGDACTTGDECCSGSCHPRKLTCK